MPHLLSDRAAAWLNSVFAAKAAQRGGIVRRSVRDVEALIHRDVFLAEVRRRGFTAVENGGQFVVFCNREPFYRVV
ncbi:N-(5'-phosphoribosyl)anthranilate isomerase [Jannaschia marina]|uniref:N-(5'-phosphoribosyl)anthranilate isomerase n=1 Tax=Jannaschia marina TaxID=2741674 RepID=UPI0015CE5678|nr:N-(5'-phosphoribosyl)anthranilate isomerase [Jannaschia marina]